MPRIDVLPVLRDELSALKAGVRAHADDRVFPTQPGNAINDSNVRNRVLAKAVNPANKRPEKAGSVPLPTGLSPHKAEAHVHEPDVGTRQGPRRDHGRATPTPRSRSVSTGTPSAATRHPRID